MEKRGSNPRRCQFEVLNGPAGVDTARRGATRSELPFEEWIESSRADTIVPTVSYRPVMHPSTRNCSGRHGGIPSRTRELRQPFAGQRGGTSAGRHERHKG